MEDATVNNLSVPPKGTMPDWCDNFLQTLTWDVNSLGLGMPITLFIGGTMVGGVVISAADYFERLGKQTDEDVARLYGEEPTGKYGERFYTQADKLRKRIADMDKNDTSWRDTTQYIHLDDARIMMQLGQFPGTDYPGTLWRGRLSQVDGFHLGVWYEIDPSKYPKPTRQE